MKSKRIGALNGTDQEFNAVYRDKDGKLMWDKVHRDMIAAGYKRTTFAEVHRRMVEYMKQRDEQEQRQLNTANHQLPPDNGA